MTNEAVAQKVRELLARKMSIEESKITGETRLSEDLGLDSFGGVEVMFEIEEAFDLKIPDSDIEQVRTVNDIVNYIVEWKNKTAQNNAAPSTPPVPDSSSKPSI
ncbi:MAG TPA: acyl carrier protein [Opitutaceae bacterium]